MTTDQFVREYHEELFRPSDGTLDQFLAAKRRTLEYLRVNFRDLLPADRDARVLDVGCGAGEFLVFLRQQGYRHLTGVDLAEPAVAQCRRLAQCEAVCTADLAGFLEAHRESFDFINLSHVIEHFPKPALLPHLQALREALRPGGLLCVTTPNCASFSGLQSRYTSLTHEIGFTERSLAKALTLAGFAEVRTLAERQPLGLRPRSLAWALSRWAWTQCLRLLYLIELGTDAPRVVTRNLLATARRQALQPAGTAGTRKIEAPL